MPPQGHTSRWRHRVLNLSMCPSIHASVRLSITKPLKKYFETDDPSLMQIGTWSMGQGHETIEFEVRRSKIEVTQHLNRSQKIF